MHCQPQPDAPDENLSASQVLPLLADPHHAPARYVYTPSTGSTNDDARKLAAAGAPHGTLVVTEQQTTGRGRHDRNWCSPPGCGIYASQLLHPERPLHEAPLLGMAAAIAAVQAINDVTRADAQIKWPNDILMHAHKIAGILTETDVLPDGSYALILGLGINVNTPQEVLPLRPRFPASSLQIELRHRVPRPRLLAAWLDRLAECYQLWQDADCTRIVSAWHKHAYGLGQTISIEQQGTSVTGILQGIAADGSLILQDPLGKDTHVLSGDVT